MCTNVSLISHRFARLRALSVLSDYSRLVNIGGMAPGWVGETTARTETGTPTIQEVSFPDGEIYALPKVTQRLLDEGIINVERMILDDVAEEFALQEGTAFITGDGTNKPTDFLDGTPVSTDDDSRAFGVLQYIAGGHASLLNDADNLLDMVFTLRPGYRSSGWWVMNSATAGVIRQLKDSQNQSLWAPELSAKLSRGGVAVNYYPPGRVRWWSPQDVSRMHQACTSPALPPAR